MLKIADARHQHKEKLINSPRFGKDKTKRRRKHAWYFESLSLHVLIVRNGRRVRSAAAGAHPPGRGRHILPFHDVLLCI
jgi:hypothetical protein